RLSKGMADTALQLGIATTVDKNIVARTIVSQAFETLNPSFVDDGRIFSKEDNAQKLNPNLEIICHKFRKVIPGLKAVQLANAIKKAEAGKALGKEEISHFSIAMEYLEKNLKGDLWVQITPGQIPLALMDSKEVADVIRRERLKVSMAWPGAALAASFGGSWIGSLNEINSLAFGSLGIVMASVVWFAMNYCRYSEISELLKAFEVHEGLRTGDPKKLTVLEKAVKGSIKEAREIVDVAEHIKEAVKASKLFEAVADMMDHAAKAIAEAEVDKENKKRLFLMLLKEIAGVENEGFRISASINVEDRMLNVISNRDTRIAMFKEAGLGPKSKQSS
ncbi:hypothetical protein ACFL4F_03020, partial [Candidatus Margulisiibacteriota bacterium]